MFFLFTNLADSADDRIWPSAAAEEDDEGDHGEHGGQGDCQEPLRHLRGASLLQRGAAVQRIPAAIITVCDSDLSPSHLYSMFLSNLLVINLIARIISGLIGFFVHTGHS